MRFLSWGVSASGVVLGRAREFRCNGYASDVYLFCFFFSSRRRHTRCSRDWSSDVCSSDLRQIGRQEVQAAINAATSFLPTDLPMPPVYSKVNPADAPILTLAVSSATLPLTKVEDLVDTRLAPKLSEAPGVGLVSLGGGQRPAIRIQVDPVALAAHGLALEDVRTAIANANVNQAKGSFDGPLRASTIDANDQLRSADDYRNIVLMYRNGAPLRVSDIAAVVETAENVKLAAWAADRRQRQPVPAIIVNIQRQPGANVIQTVDRIAALLPRLEAR